MLEADQKDGTPMTAHSHPTTPCYFCGNVDNDNFDTDLAVETRSEVTITWVCQL